MSVRSIIKDGKKKLYSTRKKNGRFTSISKIGSSIKIDTARKSKKVAKPGHGHEGDPKMKVTKKSVARKPVVKKKPASRKK